jgi:hypothetical protein
MTLRPGAGQGYARAALPLIQTERPENAAPAHRAGAAAQPVWVAAGKEAGGGLWATAAGRPTTGWNACVPLGADAHPSHSIAFHSPASAENSRQAWFVRFAPYEPRTSHRDRTFIRNLRSACGGWQLPDQQDPRWDYEENGHPSVGATMITATVRGTTATGIRAAIC